MVSKFTVKYPSGHGNQPKGITPDESKKINPTEMRSRIVDIESWNQKTINLHTSISQLLKNCDVTWHEEGCTISTDENDISAIENACKAMGLESLPLRTDLKHRCDREGKENIDQHLDQDLSRGKHHFKVR